MPNLEKALSSGRKIGSLVWYDCRDVSITPQDLKAKFQQYGLDEAYLPDRIKPKNAFQKACRLSMAKSANTEDGSVASDNRRAICKLIVDGIDKLVYGIVDLNVNESTQVIDPDFSDRVWYDKNTYSVSYDNGHPLAKQIKAAYDHLCGEYITRDISRMIVRAVDKMCAVSLRDSGVVYFVPMAFDQHLQALQDVVNNLGTCDMRVYALGDADGNSHNIEKAARSQIGSKVQELKDQIADLKFSMDQGHIKGQSVSNGIEVRIRKFRELKERCQIFSDALRIKADTLTDELTEVQSMLKRELDIDTTEA